jgi:hypothetical protein
MSFGDDVHAEPHRPTCLVFRCRRCQACVTEAHPDPSVALRRMLEAGQLATVHECDGVLAVADLVGTGPGKPRAYAPTAERP